MNEFYILILLACTLPQIVSKVSAKLLIITYDPLEFNLTFSQPIPLPRFQLLFNQYPIKYTATNLNTDSNISTSFLIQGSTQNIVRPQDFITQKYVLMFTEPLQIAQGSLNLDSFLLRAQRIVHKNHYQLHQGSEVQSYYKYQNRVKAFDTITIIVVFVVYVLTYTTIIGLNAISFISIYVYISLNSQLYTSLDYRIAFFLFFQPHQLEGDQVSTFKYICAPFILILMTLFIGIISYFTLRKLASRSVIWNYLFYFLSFKLFFTTWNVMCIPIFANMTFILQQRIVFETIPKPVTDFFIYFSIMTIVFFTYLTYFIMNPHVSQKWESWTKYTQSAEYQLFEGINYGIIGKNWMKRNLPFIVQLIKMGILICVNLDFIQIPNLLFQIGYLIYLFTYMPFKFNYYNCTNIASQIFVITFYLYRYIAHLYMGISDEITTSTDISRMLVANVVFVLLIEGIYLALGIIQYKQRIRIFLKYFKKSHRTTLSAKSVVLIPKTKNELFKREFKRDECSLSDERQSKNKKSRKAKRLYSNEQTLKQTCNQHNKCLNPEIPSKDQSPNSKMGITQMHESRSLKNSHTASKLNTSQIQKPNRRLKKEKSSLLQSICLSQEGQIF